MFQSQVLCLHSYDRKHDFIVRELAHPHLFNLTDPGTQNFEPMVNEIMGDIFLSLFFSSNFTVSVMIMY